MKANLLPRWVAVVTCTLLMAVPPVLTGCAWTDSLAGEGFRELEPDWGEGFRPLSKPGRSHGLSTKSRQVERNLGVQ
jgi:hypothetical protein